MHSNSRTHRFARRGISLEGAVRWFFASNAGLTVVILLLIVVFLVKEGLGFFPGYRRELEIYRLAGLEFVDISRHNLTAHEQLVSLFNRAYQAEINGRASRELKRAQETAAVVNAYEEQTAATREVISTNLQAGVEPTAPIFTKLRERFTEAQARALNHLPATPHLSPGERRQLIDALAQREPTANEPPQLAVTTAADYAAAREKYATSLAGFRQAIDDFEAAGSGLADWVTTATETVTETKQALQRADAHERNASDAETTANLQPEDGEAVATQADLAAKTQTLLAGKSECIALHAALRATSASLLPQCHGPLTQAPARRLLDAAHKAAPVFLAGLDATPAQLTAWRPDQPVALHTAVIRFLTGKDWVTGGEWQDFYGILPLFVGSLIIAAVALIIAIPVGIGSAIYVNQFGSRRELAFVKPIIEFIQAVPSVVLGFIGILVLGTLLEKLSQLDSLAWIPGFPIEQRLNMFTAGCLLALMSIPTIFSLAEDALNNVPAAYAEASDALGASRFQTTFRVIVPAAFSGMLAAVLLGLGRVIGETMVVLLVAGNRIKIPDFSAGLGVVFQPAHTLTGIIAQELGEVPMGSVHYRALFVVGILLFGVVLAINALAHRFITRTPV